MEEKQAIRELLILSQKKDNDLYAYYCWPNILFIKIQRKNYLTYNKENTIIVNNIEQHILKNTIVKFGFSLKIIMFCIHIIKYKADLMHGLDKMFKKANA